MYAYYEILKAKSIRCYYLVCVYLLLFYIFVIASVCDIQ